MTAVVLARLYLGADWLSTALAGGAVGVIWVALLTIAYLSRESKSLRPIGLLTTASLAVLIAGGVTISARHRADMQRYTMPPVIRTMSLADWQQGGWRSLPTRRLDLFGEFEKPFILQWTGSLASLVAALAAHGWQQPVPWTLRSALQWLSPHAKPAALPVLPRLDNGQMEALTMIKTGDSMPSGVRLIVRLWRSDVVLSSDAKTMPLWIGTVESERIIPMAGFMAVAKERHDVDGPLAALQDAIPFARVASRAAAADAGGWNGSVLLGG